MGLFDTLFGAALETRADIKNYLEGQNDLKMELKGNKTMFTAKRTNWYLVKKMNRCCFT